MKQEKSPQKSIADLRKELRLKRTPEQQAAMDKSSKEFRENFGKQLAENLNRNVREDYLTK